ncbi:tRNA pseudouridine(38-40) synthase TruA [Glaciecola sp. HTCC2999]|uniref:tRNA pseudouridine(38-40) synthase TruA n=1 Tax=Glaciecola sp. HTCC2999 TaxID=455436 RepID=UPI0000E0E88E|nr:tRNA pseudouridine(38-40) synthase TruA [Glaciecola sp. HTCC2999]
MTTNIAMAVEYYGADFYGWQRQDNVPSVQQALEDAASFVADEKVNIICSGRTDAGVHATYQIVNFKTSAKRDEKAWTLGVTTKTPDAIAVKWAVEVPDTFHARFSATARRYRYIIYNHRVPPAILAKGLTHCYLPLDAQKMHEAAQVLVGEHDFTSFRAALCQSKTPFRNIHFVNVQRVGEYVIIDIKANAFLHHMVRNIAGSLMLIGAGEQPLSWLQEILEIKDRTQAGVTAKPNGLYFVDVDYPEFDLPKSPLGPTFLQFPE